MAHFFTNQQLDWKKERLAGFRRGTPYSTPTRPLPLRFQRMMMAFRVQVNEPIPNATSSKRKIWWKKALKKLENALCASSSLKILEVWFTSSYAGGGDLKGILRALQLNLATLPKLQKIVLICCHDSVCDEKQLPDHHRYEWEWIESMKKKPQGSHVWVRLEWEEKHS